MAASPFLFVDRDGTLIEEPPDQQVDRLDKLALVAGVIPALLRLQGSGFRLVIVTNQDGLGTEAYPQAAYDAVHAQMMQVFDSQGVRFEEVLVCPHRPGDGCTCRKPHLGLVRKYLSRKDIDLERSFVIGDRLTDVELAQNMGIRGLRIEAGMGWAEVVRTILESPRRARVERTTKETGVVVEVDLDGGSATEVKTGIGFFDHMLEQLARHGRFDLKAVVRGDLHVDEHHTVEDTALAIGEALRKALGDKLGIGRYGFVLPMDEAEARVSVDFERKAVPRLRRALRPRIGGRPADGARASFFPLARRGARGDAARPRHGREHAPHDRGRVQGGRARAPSGDRPNGRDVGAEHEGDAVIAVVDTGGANLASMLHAIARAGCTAERSLGSGPHSPGALGHSPGRRRRGALHGAAPGARARRLPTRAHGADARHLSRHAAPLRRVRGGTRRSASASCPDGSSAYGLLPRCPCLTWGGIRSCARGRTRRSSMESPTGATSTSSTRTARPRVPGRAR